MAESVLLVALLFVYPRNFEMRIPENFRSSAILFSVLVCLCVLDSCSGNKEEKFLVGISQPSKDSWRETANTEFLREASFYDDIDIEIRSVSDDSKAQIEDIEYFIEKKVDLLVVSPNESSALTPVVEKAFEQGIPVILYDRKIDSEAYHAYVGANNVQIGVQMGEYLNDIMRQYPEPHNIVIIRGTKGSTADMERYEGLMSALDGSGSKYDILGVEYGNFTKEGAYGGMKGILGGLAGQSRIDAVIAFNDRMGNGVYEAFADSGWSGEFPAILGVDALSGEGEGIDCILDGTLTASFIYPTGGDVIIDVARKILNRNLYQRQNILSSTAVDKTNARIIKLQRYEIDNRQAKIDALNERLDESLESLLSQKRMAHYILSIAVLAILTCVLLLIITRMKSKLNKELNSHNIQIQKQVEELRMQKNQLQALSAELEEATNAKLVFFTNVSHEFKTPLTLILGPVQELLASNGISSAVKETVRVIYRNASRLYSLINEILDFRTYENGKMTVNYEYADIKEYIAELNKLFYDTLRRRRISFYYEVGDADFVMAFDRNKFEKIYFNLMSNALKYVGESAVIRTGLRTVEIDGIENVEIIVYNSDSYIPDDKVNDIFRRFYKVGNEYGSSGVGLALTYSLVAVMGGEITVESSKNGGTSFIVTFPFFRPDGSAAENKSVNDLSYSVNRVMTEFDTIGPDEVIADTDDDGRDTVLVVEDNIDMLNYVRDILKNEYRVLIAENGVTGADKALKYLPDIIVSDIMMPEMDGYELCRTLKENIKTADIPIVLLTACDLDKQKEMGYECGADAYMQKPFYANVLKVRLRKLIDKSRKSKQNSGENWLINQKKELSDEGVALMKKIRQYVENHIMEDISVETMISEIGFSKSNFYRKLKNITEWSPIDIVNLIRLRRAINLVLYDGKNLSEAAFASGFNSLSYFSRTFVKYYHISPREWLKEQLG